MYVHVYIYRQYYNYYYVLFVTAMSFCTCVDDCLSDWTDDALRSNSAYPNCNKHMTLINTYMHVII